MEAAHLQSKSRMYLSWLSTPGDKGLSVCYDLIEDMDINSELNIKIIFYLF